MDPDVLINPPRQARSRASLRRIVSAGRELLRERDFDAVTVDEIVARAGSSKGSFYHRFADKDSLLVYLLREEHAEALEAWSTLLDPERWRDRPLSDVLDAFLDRLLEIYRGRPSLMRAYAGKVFADEGEMRLPKSAVRVYAVDMMDAYRQLLARLELLTRLNPIVAQFQARSGTDLPRQLGEYVAIRLLEHGRLRPTRIEPVRRPKDLGGPTGG